MNKLIIATILTAASIATVSAPAFAGVVHRENHQQNRVTNGIGNGSLSQGEFNRIENREAAIRKEQRFLRNANGGTLNNFDKRVLNQQLDRSSRLIFRLKHN